MSTVKKTITIVCIAVSFFCFTSCSYSDTKERDIGQMSRQDMTVDQLMDSALAVFSYDYDGNGEKEAFVLLEPEKAYGSENSRLAELWFYHDKNFERIADETYYLPQGSIQTFGSMKVFLLEEYYTSGSLTHFWSIENGEPYEHVISGKGGNYQIEDLLHETSGAERSEQTQSFSSVFSLLNSAYDAEQFNGMFLGHTWKRYYFSWDSNHHTFIEFGGISLTEEQFSHCKNAEEVRAYISEKKGVVTEIYYRDCGIVHVNYSVQSSPDDTHYYGITLRLIDQAVYFVSTYEGTYQNAMISEIAIFPDQIPSFMLTTSESEA